MTTLEVGTKLVELCKEGKLEAALDALYAPDIVSVEAGGPPDMPREMQGIQAIMGKNKWWRENHEVHSVKVEGPFPNNDQFIVRYQFDITNKPANKRVTMDEMALYTVKNGKIVREVFFYNM